MQHEHRLMKALFRQPVDKTPVWIMRQAGRYLPEYRALRKRVPDFLTLCKTPELACEVTVQPLNRFALDAAIIFSDILTIPDAYGLGLHFVENEGPIFKNPIRTLSDIEQLPILDPEQELGYVMNAVKMTKSALSNKVPLIGFAGSPWTIATYMIEGKSSKNFSKIKSWVYGNADALHKLLNHLSTTIIDYLNSQIAAGADVVMLFDTWGGILGHTEYLEFSLQYMQKIVLGIKNIKTVPIILFTKNGGQHIIDMANTGCDAIGLDWTADLTLAKQSVGHKVALQGNLDPAILYADSKRIQYEVKKVLQQFGSGAGHIFNLGHGIYPDVDPDKVTIMIETVHNYSQK